MRDRAPRWLLASAGIAATLGCVSAGDVLTSIAPPPVLDDLALGPYQSCGLSSGAAYCWGAGESGQLGLGDIDDRDVPTPLDAGTDWIELEAGFSHSCGLRAGGSVWCWGANDYGQLGTGDGQMHLTPTFVSTTHAVTLIASTFRHTCAVYADGSLWCWGNHSEGQLGQGDDYPGPDHPTPVRVGAFSDWIAVDAGDGHTCGIRAPGTLWCWGRNSNSELGIGPGAPGQVRAPVQVGTDSDWTQIRTGQAGSCALKGQGELWCWGDDVAHELGLSDAGDYASPTRVGEA
jgi:alpha-tubulin suppressor-like RCC1 family protein